MGLQHKDDISGFLASFRMLPNLQGVGESPDMDVILQKVGDFGKYQRRRYLLLCFVIITVAFQDTGPIFWAHVPEYMCDISSHKNVSSNFPNASRPVVNFIDAGRYDHCKFISYDLTNTSVGSQAVDILEASLNGNNMPRLLGTQSCSKWIYEPNRTSIVSQWDLVCERRWIRHTLLWLQGLAAMLGYIGFGYVNDRWGRRRALCSSTLLQVILALAAPFAPEVVSFTILRTALAFTTAGQFLTAFLLGVEMVGPTWRLFSGTGLLCMRLVGVMLLAALAYIIRNHFILQLVTSLPLVGLLVNIWLGPESPRWLLAAGRRRDLKILLTTIADVNGGDVPEDLELPDQAEEEEEEGGARCGGAVPELFTLPILRTKLITLLYLWFINSLVYYGVSFRPFLPGDVSVRHLVEAVAEMCMYSLMVYMFFKYGRRCPLSVLMVIGGVILQCTAPLPPDVTSVSEALVSAAKLCVMASFCVLHVFTAELAPTAARGLGLGACMAAARLAHLLAPYTTHMEEVHPALTHVVLGGLAVTVALGALWLPETCSQPLPDHLSQADALGKGTSILCFLFESPDANYNAMRRPSQWETRPSLTGQVLEVVALNHADKSPPRPPRSNDSWNNLLSSAAL